MGLLVFPGVFWWLQGQVWFGFCDKIKLLARLSDVKLKLSRLLC